MTSDSAWMISGYIGDSNGRKSCCKCMVQRPSSILTAASIISHHLLTMAHDADSNIIATNYQLLHACCLSVSVVPVCVVSG